MALVRSPTEDRCMYPQHLDRLHDDGSVRRIRTGGGRTATTSPRSPEVPASAPVRPARARHIRRTVVRAGSTSGTTTIVLRPDGHSDAWPLPIADDDRRPAGPVSDPWPLLDVDALQLAGAEVTDPEATETEPAAERTLTPGALLSAMAAGNGPRHRRPS